MPEPRNKSSRLIWTAVAVLIGAAAVAVGAAKQRETKALPRAAQRTPASSTTSSLMSEDVKRYQVPVTSSQPSKGPADAIVTIVEWCDFQVPECKNADAVLTATLAQYGDQVRWVFRHFPEPAPGSQQSHEFARLAFEQAGKFWEAKDLLQSATGAPTRDDFERYAKQLGLDWTAMSSALDKHTHAGHIVADRMFATMFEVQEVPAFFVNGRRLQGPASSPSFKLLIDDEIGRATQLVASGVPKQQVYAELTKNGVWKQLSKARPN